MEFLKKIEEYKEVIALIVGAIGVFIACFNKFDDRAESLQDKYYFEFLPTLFELWSRNDINIIKYIKRRKLKDECIPYYILYLTDKGRKEDLEKVLRVDYRKSRPSILNNSIRAFIKSFKKIYYISVIILSVSIYLLAIIIITACFGTIEIVITQGTKAFYNILNILLASIILSAGPFLFMKFLLWVKRDSDLYNLNLKTIKEIIEHKLKEYNRDEWYI